MCLFHFRRTCTLALERRQCRKAGQAASCDSRGPQEDLLLERTYGSFTFSEAENSLPLMAFGKMQSICNLTCVFTCSFLVLPPSISPNL